MLDETWPWIEGAHGLRSQLFGMLSDADLAFSPGGQALTLGALSREISETEHAYAQSLTTLKHDWSYRQHGPDVTSEVARLDEWFHTLDDELRAALAALQGEDSEPMIDRRGSPVTIKFQLDACLQAMLIFLGKATVYLRVMDKPLPPEFQEYIG